MSPLGFIWLSKAIVLKAEGKILSPVGLLWIAKAVMLKTEAQQ